MAGSTSKRYPPELRERAVRMVAEIAGDHESQWAAMNEVARLLGIGTAETVRKWVRQVEVDAGQRPGCHDRRVGGAEAAAAGERRAQAGQRDPQSSIDFLRGRARPATPLIVEFIRTHQGRREAAGLVWGVEPICTVLTEHGLPIAPSTYYDHLALGQAPTRRQLRDEQLEAEIARVHAAHYGVYGARKVWLQLNREGVRGRSVHGRAADATPRPARRGPRQGEAHHDRRPRRPSCPRTWSSAASPRLRRTGCGLPTSRTCRRGRAGSTSRSSSTPTPAGSWAGAPAPR